ncbi:MAG: cysteine synthase family protein [Candidatus Aenigmatarchaeota archaeon]|nr:MAG: cysteine synthase family protein [Candidatus Aenigmarchaeota archaeon]
MVSGKNSDKVSVGNTPLVEVDGIFAKLECVSPTGSIKDRMAKYILEESEKRGLLKKGMRVIEATSGNTGISMSYFGRRMGYDVTIVMPENMTRERKSIIRRLGGNLILSPAERSFAEAARIRDRKAREEGYFSTDQFANPLNVECHQKTTGQEIISEMKTKGLVVDAFVAGVGTGGTLIGVAKALKRINPDVYIVAVEPSESNVMCGKKPDFHIIQGIGDGFIPDIVSDGKGGLNPLIDDVLCVSGDEAKSAALYLDKECGLCVGMSSGANYLIAKKLSERFKTVVTVFPDGFSKYQSQGLKQTNPNGCPYHTRCANLG